MATSNQWRLVSVVASILFASLLNACTTMTSVTDDSEYTSRPAEVVADKVDEGDRVLLVTQDGTAYELTTLEVSDDTIIGVTCEDCDPVEISVADIAQLHVEEVSEIRTLGASALIVSGVLVALMLLTGPPIPPGL